MPRFAIHSHGSKSTHEASRINQSRRTHHRSHWWRYGPRFASRGFRHSSRSPLLVHAAINVIPSPNGRRVMDRWIEGAGGNGSRQARGTKESPERGEASLDPRLDSVTTTLVNVLWNRAGPEQVHELVHSMDGSLLFLSSSFLLPLLLFSSRLLSYASLCAEREGEGEREKGGEVV